MSGQRLRAIQLILQMPSLQDQAEILLTLARKGLLDILPDALQWRIIRKLETLVQSIHDEVQRAGVLAVVAKFSKGDLRAEAIHELERIVMQLPDSKSQGLALVGLIEYLPDDEEHSAKVKVANEAIALLSMHNTIEFVIRTFSRYVPDAEMKKLLPHLPIEMRVGLEAVLPDKNDSLERQQISTRQEQADIFPANLSGCAAARNMEEKLNDVRSTPDMKSRVEMLGHLLKEEYLTNALKSRIIAEVLEVILAHGNLMVTRGRSSIKCSDIIALVVSGWDGSRFFRPKRLALWCDTLSAFSRLGRTNCMLNLLALMPLLIHLSDESARQEIFQALCDVARWWS